MKTTDWVDEEEIERLVDSARGGVLDVNDAIMARIGKRDKLSPDDNCFIGRILASHVLSRLYYHRMVKSCKWLNNLFRIDFDVAVKEVVGLFQQSIDRGCDSAFYHLAVFCWEMSRVCYLLSEGVFDEVDCDATEDCKCFSIEKAEEYHDLFLTNWQEALNRRDPRALFDEAMHRELWVMEHDLSQEQRSLFLRSAFNKGYPLAIYEHAKQLKDVCPEDYEKLMEKALHYPSVKSLHDFELEIERKCEEDMKREERESMREYEEPTPTLADLLDDPAEFELNTHGGLI